MHNTINEKDQTIFIQNGVINEPVCLWKHKAFSTHKQDKEIFIETGTNTGNGIANALALGFKTIYSIEINPNNYYFAKKRWKDYKNVTVLLGDTANHIQSIIENISTPVFFWLDAHFNTSEPTYKELKFIKEHKVKTHTILIDDMSLYFNLPHIEQTIKDINPNYVISYEPTWRSQKEILAAKVEN
jgi:hypothetical protein